MAARAYLQAAAFAALVGTIAGVDIEIGGQYGWNTGVMYPDMCAAVGDVLVFSYSAAVHDVWLMSEDAHGSCKFERDEQTYRLSAAASGNINAVVRFPVTSAGVYHFGCSIGGGGHCSSGQSVQVRVPLSGCTSINPKASLVGVDDDGDKGSCAETVEVTPGVFEVSCISPPVRLKPGEMVNTNRVIPNPFPAGAASGYAVLSRSAFLSRGDGTPVPLSEVYVHHFLSSLIGGNGAELARVSPPYSEVCRNASSPRGAPDCISYVDVIMPDASPITTFHLINTVGVDGGWEDAVLPCIECRCIPTVATGLGGREVELKLVSKGGIGCCRDCPSTDASGEATSYHLNYSFRYTEINETYMKPVFQVGIDGAQALGSFVEYDVPASTGPGDEFHDAVLRGAVDWNAGDRNQLPAPEYIELIRCVAHMHIGAVSATLYNTETGEAICTATAEYAEEGPDMGYLVGMVEEDFPVPIRLPIGLPVHLTSRYKKSSQPHTGVMSLFSLHITSEWAHRGAGEQGTLGGLVGAYYGGLGPYVRSLATQSIAGCEIVEDVAMRNGGEYSGITILELDASSLVDVISILSTFKKQVEGICEGRCDDACADTLAQTEHCKQSLLDLVAYVSVAGGGEQHDTPEISMLADFLGRLMVDYRDYNTTARCGGRFDELEDAVACYVAADTGGAAKCAIPNLPHDTPSSPGGATEAAGAAAEPTAAPVADTSGAGRGGMWGCRWGLAGWLGMWAVAVLGWGL